MATLTELTFGKSEVLDRLKEIEREIIENDGEVTDELDARHRKCLDELLAMEGSIEDKVDAYGAVMTELEQEIEAVKGRAEPIKEMRDNLRSRRKALERNRERMKDRLMHYLRELDEERVEGETFRFRRQTNGGKRSVDIQDGVHPEDVPEKFTREKFDYGEIRTALKELNTLREEYDRLRGKHEEAKQAVENDEEPEEPPEKIAKAAKSVMGDMQELDQTVGQFAELEERGEHIRKF